MTVIKNIFLDTILGIWIVVAIFVTICLLSYNEFNIPVFDTTTLLIVDNEELEPQFNKGDLLFIKRDSDKKIEVGEPVFFYNGNKSNEYLINIGTITSKKQVTSKETTYTMNGMDVSGSYVIGKVNGTVILPVAGTVLSIFTSKWGYMFLVILPTIFLIIYEIMMIIDSARSLKQADRENEKVSMDA